MYYGEVGELAAKMDGRTRWALMVPRAGFAVERILPRRSES